MRQHFFSLCQNVENKKVNKIMKTIFMIEDNQTIQEEISSYLHEQGFHTVVAEDFTDIPTALEREKADLLLLDINLGEADGYELCREVRKVSKIPIIFVTGRNSDMDELKGITLGGDDFIRKPYNLPVLLARIRRLLSRSGQVLEELTASDAVLNLVLGQISCKNETLELSKNEVKILYYLFLNQDSPVSRDDLIEYLWDSKLYVDENILNVNLSRLRKRLNSIGLNDFIRTIPGKGYQLRREDP